MAVPEIIFVLGMHRSGTSVVARALTALGVVLGENFRAPMRENPKGFFEDRDFVKLNNAILAALGLRWDSLGDFPDPLRDTPVLTRLERQARKLLESRLASHRPFGVKDPRMCRLLPFWRSTVDKITRDVGCVVVARHPLLVARSLARRNQLPIEHGLQLWQLHMKTLVRRIDESWRQVTVEYDQLLDDPEHQLHRVADALGLAHPAASAVREFGATFLDESLRHNKSGAMEALPPHVMETWNELRRLSLLA